MSYGEPLAALLAERGTGPGTVFTIHNMAFQSLFRIDALDAVDWP